MSRYYDEETDDRGIMRLFVAARNPAEAKQRALDEWRFWPTRDWELEVSPVKGTNEYAVVAR